MSDQSRCGHGNRVGSASGGEHLCGRCEDGDVNPFAPEDDEDDSEFSPELEPIGEERAQLLVSELRKLIDTWTKRAVVSETAADASPSEDRRKYFAARAQAARSYASTLEVVAKAALGIVPTIGGAWVSGYV